MADNAPNKPKMPAVAIIPNGFQTAYTIDLVNSLAQNGVPVEFIGSDIYNPRALDPAVTYLNLRGSHSGSASKLAKLRRVVVYYIRLIRYAVASTATVFHVGWLRFPFFEGIVITVLFKCLNKRIVYTAHNVLPHGKDSVFVRGLFRVIYNLPDVVIAHTPFIKHRIANEFGVRPGTIALLKHGVYQVKDSAAVSKSDARVRLGLGDADNVILSFGRIRKYKGIDILVSAYRQCKDSVPGLRLVVAGDVERSYMRELTQILSIGRDPLGIISILKHIPDEEVELLFKASDVVVLPYTEASQSGVLFLSYAYGRPVIVSDIGSFPGDVIDGKTGYTFRAGNADALSATIQRFFSHEAMRRPRTEDAIKEFARREYSWRDIGARLSRIYGRLGAKQSNI